MEAPNTDTYDGSDARSVSTWSNFRNPGGERMTLPCGNKTNLIRHAPRNG